MKQFFILSICLLMVACAKKKDNAGDAQSEPAKSIENILSPDQLTDIKDMNPETVMCYANAAVDLALANFDTKVPDHLYKSFRADLRALQSAKNLPQMLKQSGIAMSDFIFLRLRGNDNERSRTRKLLRAPMNCEDTDVACTAKALSKMANYEYNMPLAHGPQHSDTLLDAYDNCENNNGCLIRVSAFMLEKSLRGKMADEQLNMDVVNGPYRCE